jgi:hypothetical protein
MLLSSNLGLGKFGTIISYQSKQSYVCLCVFKNHEASKSMVGTAQKAVPTMDEKTNRNSLMV